MTIAIFGEKTLGECVPAALSINARLLADIQTKLAAAIKLQARLTVTPPSLAGNLQAAVKVVESLSIRPQLPGATLSLAAFAKVIGELSAKLEAALSFNVAFGAAGVMALAYTGELGSMGGEISSTVESLFAPSNEAVALVFIASAPETKLAMNLIFGVNL